jgi:hypothetical protein
MHPTLAYELQKTIIEERLRNATLAQQHRLEATENKPRVAARLRRWSAARGHSPWLVHSAECPRIR